MTEHGQEQVETVETETDVTASAPDTVESLQQQLAAAKQEAEENFNKYLRSHADMENYKKRLERTYAGKLRDAKKDLLKRLLGVRDNLERALLYGESPGVTGETIMEGVRLTSYQLDQLLDQEGVKPIETLGKPFDPHLEEALQSVDDESVPDHTVVQEVRRGYVYNDEVLQPAQVIVSVHRSQE
jgi:molecular chaperone GrpE